IYENEVDTSAETIFGEYENLVTLHREFEAHHHNEGLNIKLNKMKRNELLKQKRKLFIEWYILKHQNEKILKEMIYELSHMIFATTRTVEYDIFNETTATNGGKVDK